MSGGVDSSVAAGLLVEEGYEVMGVSLRLWDGGAGSRVCSDYRGAKEVAEILGIRHGLLDLRSQFFEAVVGPFAQSYLEGRTPNPCVACNRDFKLGVLLQWAKDHDADYVATGHYARVLFNPSSRRVTLLRGADKNKDQSYFLFALSREQLAHTLFPLGDWNKETVREKAHEFGLPAAYKPDSQDICFGDYHALVESLAGDSDLHRGEIVDRSGKVLGHHQGIHRLTVGQRRGLGLAGPDPQYVLEINGRTKRVVVGKKEELGSHGLIVHSVNWIDPPEKEEIAAEVQLRYRSPSVPCHVRAGGEGRCEVRFQEFSPPVTPGQAAVFYQGERVLGGGWIERAIPA